MGNMYASIYHDSKMVEDVKTIMLSDIRERKELARGAGRRKSGAKSKKCGLPSDHMTKKQLQEMNGPVAVKMAPLSRFIFLQKTDEFRARWYKWVREQFTATSMMIAYLQDGRHADDVRAEITDLRKRGFDVGTVRHTTPSNDDLTRWNEWLDEFHWEGGRINIEAYYNHLSKGRGGPRIKTNKTKSGDETMTLKENTGEPIPVQPSKAVEPAHLDITAASIAFGRDGTDMFPIDLKIFLKLSVEDKVRYINMLRERFHVTYRSISKMMRANSDPYISNWCNKMHRLEGTTFTVFPKGEEPDAEQRHQWNSWLQKNHWTTGFVKVNEKTSATKKHRVKKAEKLVSETELIAHVESLGATMTTTEEAKVATKAVSSLTINTMTASTEEIENALEWVRSGLTFLKQPKVTITFTLEEV